MTTNTKTESIRLYGTFGTGEGQISHQSVLDQLALIGSADVLEIRIASKGGDAWEGLGIYNALKDFPAKKVVYIDAYAMSVASWVAMVGDEILIAENGMFMYHAGKLRPASFRTSEQLHQDADTVAQMDEQMADTYASRTGIPRDQILAEMKAETWLKGKDAVARGFATKLMPNRQMVALGDLSNFTNVPEWVQLAPEPGIPNQVEDSMDPVVTPVAATPEVVPGATTATATPTTPATPVVVPPVANVVDTGAIENSATIRERTRIREVRAACEMAGCAPEVTNEYIDKGLQVQDVRNQLFATICANRKPIGESGATSAEAPAIANAVDAKLEAEWAANESTIKNMGVSKETYIASRKQDLAPAVK